MSFYHEVFTQTGSSSIEKFCKLFTTKGLSFENKTEAAFYADQLGSARTGWAFHPSSTRLRVIQSSINCWVARATPTNRMPAPPPASVQLMRPLTSTLEWASPKSKWSSTISEHFGGSFIWLTPIPDELRLTDRAFISRPCEARSNTGRSKTALK